MEPLSLDAQIWVAHVADASIDWTLLSADEIARANAMPRARAELYILGRTLLRQVIAPLAEIRASELRLSRSCRRCGDSRHGKPFVPGSELDFSLSYGPGLVLVAVAPYGPIGVDVHGADEILGFHRAWACNQDKVALEQLSPPDRTSIAARSWARKEAVAKADGRGLELPLSAVEGTVATGPCLRPRADGRTWHVHDLDLSEATDAPVVGALAVSAEQVHIVVSRYVVS
jgi:4'-phosphopantetheinyl transferase